MRDEMLGFAKSRVMIVLWVILPLLAALGFFLLPQLDADFRDLRGNEMPLIVFMGFMLSSIAGTVAAIATAVDIVSEKNRKVYELFVIRPVNPSALLWAKCLAVFISVTVACVVAMMLGVVIDFARGVDYPPGMVGDVARSMASLVGVVLLSATVGVLFGVISKSILVAVIFVLYVGQNITIVPVLPTFFGIGKDSLWIPMLVTAGLALGMMWLSGVIFRRHEY